MTIPRGMRLRICLRTIPSGRAFNSTPARFFAASDVFLWDGCVKSKKATQGASSCVRHKNGDSRAAEGLLVPQAEKALGGRIQDLDGDFFHAGTDAQLGDRVKGRLSGDVGPIDQVATGLNDCR